MANTVKNVKNSKKKGRRLKRSIRKTLGALFMASAIAVAAIPVDGLQADNGNDGIAAQAAVDHTGHDRTATSYRPVSDRNRIPQIDENTDIYTSGDRVFRFAYVTDGGQKVAMLLGYDNGYVEGKSMTIPNTVDAYEQYTTVNGTDAGYVAVGASGNYLFYRKRVDKADVPVSGEGALVVDDKDYPRNISYTWRDEPNPDYVAGNGQQQTVRKYYVSYSIEEGDFVLCGLDNVEDWREIATEDLYYYTQFNDATNPVKVPTDMTTSNPDFAKVTSSHINDYGHIKNANVAYIGNQVVEPVSEGSSKWVYKGKKVTAANPQDGVFAGTSNIVELNMGKQFRGVGDYAFYGSGITSITIENGLDTISEGAFKNCIRLTSVNIDVDAPLKSIGAEAFYNCAELTRISLPWSVETIGDSAFEKCIKMVEIDLCSEGFNKEDETKTLTNLLSHIGRDAFKDCKLLPSITFPSTFHGESKDANGKEVKNVFWMSAFSGCEKLTFITARDPELTFVEEECGTCGAGKIYYGYDDFKAMVTDDFYFEGIEDSALHRMCHNNCFAFSYLTTDNAGNYVKEDKYEITLPDVDDPVNNGRNTYVVTSQSNLISYTHEGTVHTISIPVKIGPYTIVSLDPEVIANQCHVETVILASSVKTIGDRAFQGCHNLTNVIFKDYNLDANDNVLVGTNAFWTQHFTGTHTCGGTVETDTEYDKGAKQKLHFTGPISSTFGPFDYAMSPSGKYSDGIQTDSYITYYSGWPTNLEIRYNADKGLSELVDFPAVCELGSKKYDSKTYKYLRLPDAEIDSSYPDEDWSVYEAAMARAYDQYVSSQISSSVSLTPYQREVIDAALNIHIPDGVDVIKEGLIYEKELLDIMAAENGAIISGGNASVKYSVPEKTITADSLMYVDGANTYEKEDGSRAVNTTGKDINGDGTQEQIVNATFAGCKYLTDITLNSRQNADGTKTGLVSVGDYAFWGCEGLKTASLPDTLTTMGVCPFYGCQDMTYVNFQNNKDFVCEDSIIFGPDSNGQPYSKIVECLEGIVVKYIETAQVEGVTEVGEAAFRNTDVEDVDLSATTIATLPERTFAETGSLRKLTLPASLQLIDDNAFRGSSVNYLSVLATQNIRSNPDAFTGLVDANGNPRTDYAGVLWYCAEDTVAERLGQNWNFTVRYDDVTYYYNVIFYYYDNDRQTFVQVDQVDENGEKELVSTEEEVRFPAQIGDEVTMDGINQILTSWELIANPTTWTFSARYERPQWNVTFRDSDGTLIAVKGVVNEGNALVVAPQPGVDFQVPEGRSFVGWKVGATESLSCVVSDMTAIADYGAEGECLIRYYVKKGSLNNAWELYYSQTVKNGDMAPNIYVESEVAGYHIDGWDRPLSNPITEDTQFYANYVPGPGSGGNGSGSGNSSGGTISPDGLYGLTVVNGSGSGRYPEGAQVVISAADAPEGQKFEMWTLMPTEATVSDMNRSQAIVTMPAAEVAAIANYTKLDPSEVTPSGELHTLTVQNGSGSGSYKAGTQVIVTANSAPKNQEFSSWTVSPAATVVTDKTLSAVVVTMPDNDVAMIANYRANTGNTGTGNSGSGNNGRYPSSSGSGGKTTVVIDKNGISNTVVADATVNGSSDNFMIKITASTDAEAAALQALMAEYGSLDNIKFVAMDISLYDSTGQTKITDTSGFSIDITLPLPDSLITYAGNNKVAGVVNNRLDKLSPRFTTINGVPCIVFRAEHFSPYLIYVDTGNLTAGTVSDNTPKTGDIVHPKWFLAIGLASLSFVMFMQKDSRSRKKQKVAVRAR